MTTNPELHDKVLEVFKSTIWDHVRVSHGRQGDDLFFQQWRDKGKAMAYELIETNYKKVSSMHIDVDHADGYDRLMKCAIKPNIIMRNRKNGQVHATYLYALPYWRPKKYASRLPGPIHRAKLLWDALNAQVGGDLHYNQRLVKNPFHKKWDVSVIHDHLFTFDDIQAGVNIQAGIEYRKSLSSRKITKNGIRSRHISLYDDLREFAYGEKAKHSSKETFDQSLWNKAQSLNVHNLARSWLKSTWKNVCTWVWDVYKPGKTDNRRRGVMGGVDGDQRKRSQAGQEFSAKRKRNTTQGELEATFWSQAQKGVYMTQKALAALVGVSRRTVQKYWKEITGKAGSAAKRIARSITRAATAITTGVKAIVDEVMILPWSKCTTRVQVPYQDPVEPIKEERIQARDDLVTKARKIRLISLQESNRQAKVNEEFGARYQERFGPDVYDRSSKGEARRLDQESKEFMREWELNLDKDELIRVTKAKKQAAKEAKAALPKKSLHRRIVDKVRGLISVEIGGGSITIPQTFTEQQIWRAWHTGFGVIED